MSPLRDTVERMLSHRKSKTPLYQVWAAMLARCRNPNDRSWKNYGARGIRVCARWFKFENFLADMGERPPELTLERRNNNGHYEPSNCYWATRTTQGRNSRRIKLTEALAEEIRGRFEHGESMASIARRLNISRPNVWDVVTNRIWRTADSPAPTRLGRDHVKRDNLGRYC